MKRYLFLCLPVLLIGCCGSECSAQIVRLEVDGLNESGQSFVGKASAVCIGESEDGGSVFLTARHNFREANRGRIRLAGEWHAITRVNESRTADVASFEVKAKSNFRRVGTRVRYRERVWIGGFGPLYNQSGPVESFSGVIYEQEIHGDGGLHPIVGDSGGPVTQDDEVVGIVSGYVETSCRSDHAERAYPTVYSDLDDINECLAQVYQSGRCGPNGCPIYIRPQIQQPMIGIGIPVGPPRIVGVTSPPPPQPLRPIPDPAFCQGPAGPRGPIGQPGERGPQGEPGRSVRQEDVEAAVYAYLEANIDRIKGPKGDQGPAGVAGARGERGPAGAAGPQGLPGESASVPDSPPDQPPVDDTTADRRILYFTSTKGCENCRPTDATVQRLKAQGYPITVIDLDPKETEIRGVPRVHILKDARDVSGQSNVSTYLGLLVP